LICFTAITSFAVLATPLHLAAQDNHNKKQSHYTVTDLGTLGGTFSEAVGINNSGSMAGSSAITGDVAVHAALWQHGVITDLGTLGGPNSVAPEAEPQPNEKGGVAGASDTTTPDPNREDFCGFGTHLICLPFIWKEGVLTALPTLGGNNAEAWQVNDRGQAIGAAENTTQDPNCTAFTLEVEPVIWERGTIQELPTVSGDLDGLAQAINQRGQGVGISTNCPSELFVFPSHAVLWTGGPGKVSVIDLGNLGSTLFNIAFGINNRGQVVGQSGLTGEGIVFHAFLWTKDDGMRDLGTLPGDVVSWAETINSKGEAVGTSFDANINMHPFVWRDGMMTNLNTLIPPDSPWLLLEALGNNDRGQIVGYGLRTDIGEVHAYVATPCDEKQGDGEGCGEGGGENAMPQTNPAALTPGNRMPAGMSNRFRFPWGQRNLASGSVSSTDQKQEPRIDTVTDDWLGDHSLPSRWCWPHCQHHSGYCEVDMNGRLDGECVGHNFQFCDIQPSKYCPRGKSARSTLESCGPFGSDRVALAWKCSF
jgi:probable HAF family extracellular repeat protein